MNRRHFIVAGSLGIIGAGCSAGTNVQTTNAPTGLPAFQDRKAMPPFSLPNLDGNMVRSSDLLGSVAILRFWATWCSICKAEMPSVQRAFTDFQGKKVTILAISIDEGGANDVKPFLTEHRYTMPVVLDTTADLFNSYGLSGTPGTFIADSQGILVAGGLGPVDFDRPEFRKYILDLAGEGRRS